MKQRNGTVDSLERLPLVRDLFGLGIPAGDIAALVGWSRATIANDITRLGGAKVFPQRPKKREVFAAVLQAYAALTVLRNQVGKAVPINLPDALAWWLCEDDILAMLRGMLMTMDCLIAPQVPQGREGYARLLGEVFQTQHAHRDVRELWLVMFGDEQRSVWRDYLGGIAAGNHALPVSREELDLALVHMVLAQHRADIMPIWDDAVLVAMDRAIATLTEREQRVLCARFGLQDARRKTLRELGTDCSVSLERIREIQAKAVQKLRVCLHHDPLRSYVAPLQNALATIAE